LRKKQKLGQGRRRKVEEVEEEEKKRDMTGKEVCE